MEDVAANVGPEGSTVQISIEDPEEVRFAVTSVAVEAATTITVPEASATLSVPDEPVVGLTPA